MSLQHAIVFLMSALLPVSATWAEPGQTVNLLTNGGFESGSTGWQLDAGHELERRPGRSHRSQVCLTGEVTLPRQALRLRRSVNVRSGNRYQFSVWAKATNGTKMVLWAMLPGKTDRTMVASWTNVKPGWRSYRTPISISEDGELQLELITPSAYDAPPGRIWVDDIELLETEMPPLVNVSEGPVTHERGDDHDGPHGLFCDEPAMEVSADGSVYVAFNRFHDSVDSLQVVQLQKDPGGFRRSAQWQLIDGRDGVPGDAASANRAAHSEEGGHSESVVTGLLGIKMASAGQQVAIAYAAERANNWDIYLTLCDGDGPRSPVRVTRDAGVDVDPAITWHEGTAWLAWESNRNGLRQVFAASVTDGVPSEPTLVSAPDANSYDPSIVSTSDGRTVVAWHTFRDNDYNVFVRDRSVDQLWRPEQQITQAATIDRHAFLFSRDREVWLGYENAQTERYHISRTNHRHLIVGRVGTEGLEVPELAGSSPLDVRCEAGFARFDANGRLWLAMLRPRLPRAGWDVVITRLDGDHWIQPIHVSGRKGMDRTPQLAFADGQVVVSLQTDDTPQSWSDLDKMAHSTSEIFLASLPCPDANSVPLTTLVPLVESEEPFEAADIRVQRGEDLAMPSIQYRGQKLQLYFGDLHEHSDVSVCNRVGDQSLDESYQSLRDLARHDFVCITDHGYNINPYLWHYSAKLARVNDDPQRFMTFLGQEWTSTFEEYSSDHPNGFYGHRNLILADLFFPTWWNARNRQTPSQVWDDLKAKHANFVHIPHQLADTGNVPTDWHFHDERAQPVAEIFQTRGSYEYYGAPRQAARTIPRPGSFLQDAWARDIVIGVIASPDHGGGYGKACVFAPDLTREAILDALRARHCYGTTAAKIFLDVRVDGHLMGEKIVDEAGPQVRVQIHVRCPQAIDRIEVCRSNKYIWAHRPGDRKEAQVTFVDREPLEGRCYYYVRVMQQDEEIAWSSPVWFGVEH